VKTPQQMLLAQKDADVDGAADEDSADLRALFDQVNSLPVDDPLRQPANAAAMAANQTADLAADNAARQVPQTHGVAALPDKVLAAFRANGNTTSVMPDAGTATMQRVSAPVIRPQVEARGNGAVVIDAGKRVAVPQFHGAGLRTVVENAAHLGLRVQTLGSGLAMEQAPAAGTMVPLGTEIIVRFAR
jgi:cell division protein FtsI (penicillin-binding protein 3)